MKRKMGRGTRSYTFIGSRVICLEKIEGSRTVVVGVCRAPRNYLVLDCCEIIRKLCLFSRKMDNFRDFGVENYH